MTTQDKAVQDNINVVRKLFEFFNKDDSHTLNTCEDQLAPNVQLHDPIQPKAKPGIQTIKQAEADYLKAMPNKKTKIDQIFGTGDQVVVRWTCTGTHKGPYQGIPPTNKDIKTTGISIYKLANGKVVEIWQNWDALGFMEQIGEIKPVHAH